MKTDSKHVGHFLEKLATAVGAVSTLLPMHTQHSHKLTAAVEVLGVLANAFSEQDGGGRAIVKTDEYSAFKKWQAMQAQQVGGTSG